MNRIGFGSEAAQAPGLREPGMEFRAQFVQGKTLKSTPMGRELLDPFGTNTATSSTGRAPGRRPETILAALGVIAEGGCGGPAARGIREDPAFGDARFPDGAECGPRSAGLK